MRSRATCVRKRVAKNAEKTPVASRIAFRFQLARNVAHNPRQLLKEPFAGLHTQAQEGTLQVAHAQVHVTLMVLKDPRSGMYWLLCSESTRDEPECWEGTRDEIMERWRHTNRVLQAECFLHEPQPNPDSDFDEFI